MTRLSISQVAHDMGPRPSAIRYYESIGVLPPAERQGGRRVYGSSVLDRLAAVQRARRMGFTLEEIRELFTGFDGEVSAADRWQQISARKLKQLEGRMAGLKAQERLLKAMRSRCRCETFEQCGRGIYRSERRPSAAG